MSNRPKAKSAKKTEEKVISNQEALSYIYRPETSIQVPAETLNSLLISLTEIRSSRLTVNIDESTGKRTGYGIQGKDMDIEDLWRYLVDVHKGNIEKGLTVEFSELQKEMAEKQNVVEKQ